MVLPLFSCTLNTGQKYKKAVICINKYRLRIAKQEDSHMHK